jgi:probable DNA metabolism protein
MKAVSPWLKQVVYDGSLAGLLSVVFDVFDQGLKLDRLLRRDRYVAGMFEQPITVATDDVKARRVWTGIGKLEGFDPELVLRCWLFDTTQSDTDIVHLLARVFREGVGAAQDYRDEAIFRCKQVQKKMFREIHRMHAFVRFRETADGLYLATIAPDFNVLPLAVEHFEQRYQDQEWLIWDETRNYGFLYQPGQTKSKRVERPDPAINEIPESEQVDDASFAEREDGFQKLWSSYFQSVNISERNNSRLHKRHVPPRYWRYLTEKW